MTVLKNCIVLFLRENHFQQHLGPWASFRVRGNRFTKFFYITNIEHFTCLRRETFNRIINHFKIAACWTVHRWKCDLLLFRKGAKNCRKIILNIYSVRLKMDIGRDDKMERSLCPFCTRTFQCAYNHQNV